MLMGAANFFYIKPKNSPVQWRFTSHGRGVMRYESAEACRVVISLRKWPSSYDCRRNLTRFEGFRKPLSSGCTTCAETCKYLEVIWFVKECIFKRFSVLFVYLV